MNPAFVLKKVSSAHRHLKGISSNIPNQNISIHTLSLQEAKDSSAVENITTTHDELLQRENFSE
ncbi:Fic/DOC family N-terminal domain-containing protein [Leptospira interrogans]|uniref:Fic/DOC family N-terminal domain-containing protein n=1 Tax=Leptospira interrogans TaxID=173 RepID=A0AAV9FT45_LEPIR|nr:Fic/DOC family N-terminal domain-containing protein [Leptospira interrogans]EJP17862.1 Fic/DOC family N-terminal domain protein [Leptospira interrogans str. FPW2026]KAK2618849.1 Fic/DOC family N-terminal domain-containing protein [Leptospira interrogans]